MRQSWETALELRMQPLSAAPFSPAIYSSSSSVLSCTSSRIMLINCVNSPSSKRRTRNQKRRKQNPHRRELPHSRSLNNLRHSLSPRKLHHSRGSPFRHSEHFPGRRFSYFLVTFFLYICKEDFWRYTISIRLIHHRVFLRDPCQYSG